MKNIKVSDVMTRDVVSVMPNNSLLDCAKVFVKKKVGSLVVLDKRRLVGFITEGDILWALTKRTRQDLNKIRVIDITRRKIATIRPDATLEEAIRKMKKFKFRRLPVVFGNEIVGIITIRDILTYNPDMYPELNEIEKIREETEKLKLIKKSKYSEYMHEGTCEKCGVTDILQKIDGRLLCNTCVALI